MGIQSGNIRLALLTGLLLIVLYDLMRIVQIASSGSLRHRILPDFFFVLFCGVVTELLSIAAEFGRVRFYLIACELISVCLYQMTLGMVTRRFAMVLYRIVCRCRQVRRFLISLFLSRMRRLAEIPSRVLQKRNRKNNKKMGKIS